MTADLHRAVSPPYKEYQLADQWVILLTDCENEGGSWSSPDLFPKGTTLYVDNDWVDRGHYPQGSIGADCFMVHPRDHNGRIMLHYRDRGETWEFWA